MNRRGVCDDLFLVSSPNTRYVAALTSYGRLMTFPGFAKWARACSRAVHQCVLPEEDMALYAILCSQMVDSYLIAKGILTENYMPLR